jgi:hypothetical protein
VSVFTNPASSTAEETAAYTAALLDLLGARDPLAVLRQMPPELERACAGLSAEQLTKPEAPGKWSVRHVLQHLADSELVGGFRFRMVLAHDRPHLAGYDQDLWVDRLHYDGADANEALEEFKLLRRSNVRVLAGATREDLQRVGLHAERGEESLERLMRLYAGHDLLHLRQIARIRQAVTAS